MLIGLDMYQDKIDWLLLTNPPKKDGWYPVLLKDGDIGYSYYRGDIWTSYVGIMIKWAIK